MTKSGQERRRAHRKPLKVEVQVGLDRAHGLVYFDTSDISQSGTFLVSDLLLDIGERMALTIHIPGEKLPVSVKARVVRVNAEPRKKKDDPPPGMGIEFVQITREDETKLMRFLHGGAPAPHPKK